MKAAELEGVKHPGWEGSGRILPDETGPVSKSGSRVVHGASQSICWQQGANRAHALLLHVTVITPPVPELHQLNLAKSLGGVSRGVCCHGCAFESPVPIALAM